MESLETKMNCQEFVCGIELVSTRGTMGQAAGVNARDYANDLISFPSVDWVSITDNAGGNPMLAPAALGRPILFGGKEVVIHLTCKDINRYGLESVAWQLASEGFDNILAMTGDAPVKRPEGQAKPVFDIDSVGLISILDRMNKGLNSDPGHPEDVAKTNFFVGAVTTNFKLNENEVIPQYLKLEKKIECGARFIINQIGYDSRKMHELICYMRYRDLDKTPLIGNVFVLNPRAVRLFHKQGIPGVVVSDDLYQICQKEGNSPDKGKYYFLGLAARQMAVYRGLGYKGVYISGIHKIGDLERILEIEKTFSEKDWKEFAREIRFSRENEFFLFAEDHETGLSMNGTLNPDYLPSTRNTKSKKNPNTNYLISKLVHYGMFTPGKGMHNIGEKICRKAKDPMQGPVWLRKIEKVSKAALFDCRDCGDCSLPEIAFLCPESKCAKNQRNGPCGGTRDGLCEVDDFPCIWSKAYDRLKYQGNEQQLLDHAPVIQDQALRGTSSWANFWLERDHFGKNLVETKNNARGTYSNR